MDPTLRNRDHAAGTNDVQTVAGKIGEAAYFHGDAGTNSKSDDPRFTLTNVADQVSGDGFTVEFWLYLEDPNNCGTSQRSEEVGKGPCDGRRSRYTNLISHHLYSAATGYQLRLNSVSYTHLTLPTICSV